MHFIVMSYSASMHEKDMPPYTEELNALLAGPVSCTAFRTHMEREIIMYFKTYATQFPVSYVHPGSDIHI